MQDSNSDQIEHLCQMISEGWYTLFAETMLRPTPPAFVEIRNTNICGSLLNLSTASVPTRSAQLFSGEYADLNP